MPFLYGNHIHEAHLGRITEDTPEHQGVTVYSMNDVPLTPPLLDRRQVQGFGFRSHFKINSRY